MSKIATDLPPELAQAVLTRPQLAAMFKVSQYTITNWVQRGMPCFYVGKMKTQGRGSKPRFVFADCLAWVQRGEF